MSAFVLIPGACHGGWWFEPVAQRLRELGHRAYAVTLTGLGDRAHLLTAAVNLETHIHDVIALLDNERLSDVILVGHSYAGMVVRGVADRAGERVDALVYVDAFVPDDGDSTWNLTTDEQRAWFIEGAAGDGIGIAPMPFFDPRATPHPLASMIQRLTLTGPERSFRRKDYVYATEFDSSPFTPTYRRLQTAPDWHVHPLAVRHNVLADGPDLFVDLLLSTLPAT
jgi:pimeloyl-ACP methyl ester carboxylesterase